MVLKASCLVQYSVRRYGVGATHDIHRVPSTIKSNQREVFDVRFANSSHHLSIHQAMDIRLAHKPVP